MAAINYFLVNYKLLCDYVSVMAQIHRYVVKKSVLSIKNSKKKIATFNLLATYDEITTPKHSSISRRRLIRCLTSIFEHGPCLNFCSLRPVSGIRESSYKVISETTDGSIVVCTLYSCLTSVICYWEIN